MADLSPAQRQVWEGVGVALALLSAFLLFLYAVLDTWADWGPAGPVGGWTEAPMYLMAFFGVGQFLYVVPCFFFFKARRSPQIAKGLLMGALFILAANLVLFFFWAR